MNRELFIPHNTVEEKNIFVEKIKRIKTINLEEVILISKTCKYLNYNDLLQINIMGQKIVENDVLAMYGVREEHLLSSIPNSIKQNVFGKELYPTIIDKCSHIWEVLSKYHCFYNGNKRTALIATILLLKINGYTLNTSKVDLFDISINIAKGEMNKKKVREFLLENSEIDLVAIHNLEENASILVSNEISKIKENLEVMEVIKRLAQT